MGGERLLGIGVGGWGEGVDRDIQNLADRKNKKEKERGEAIVPGKRCPGQACDLQSFLRWPTFGAAGDGGIYLSVPVL